MAEHSTADPSLRVFVYGTLKCGYGNHTRLCQEYASRSAAYVRGRVVDRPEGVPTLFVPLDDILASGTADLQADCRLTERLAPKIPAIQPTTEFTTTPAPPWRRVAGEVYTFNNGTDRLRALDFLEDFYPGEPSMYCRVILPVCTSQDVVPCWAYISPHSARFEAEHAGLL